MALQLILHSSAVYTSCHPNGEAAALKTFAAQWRMGEQPVPAAGEPQPPPLHQPVEDGRATSFLPT